MSRTMTSLILELASAYRQATDAVAALEAEVNQKRDAYVAAGEQLLEAQARASEAKETLLAAVISH